MDLSTLKRSGGLGAILRHRLVSDGYETPEQIAKLLGELMRKGKLSEQDVQFAVRAVRDWLGNPALDSILPFDAENSARAEQLGSPDFESYRATVKKLTPENLTGYFLDKFSTLWTDPEFSRSLLGIWKLDPRWSALQEKHLQPERAEQGGVQKFVSSSLYLPLISETLFSLGFRTPKEQRDMQVRLKKEPELALEIGVHAVARLLYGKEKGQIQERFKLTEVETKELQSLIDDPAALESLTLRIAEELVRSEKLPQAIDRLWGPDPERMWGPDHGFAPSKKLRSKEPSKSTREAFALASAYLRLFTFGPLAIGSAVSTTYAIQTGLDWPYAFAFVPTTLYVGYRAFKDLRFYSKFRNLPLDLAELRSQSALAEGFLQRTSERVRLLSQQDALLIPTLPAVSSPREAPGTLTGDIPMKQGAGIEPPEDSAPHTYLRATSN